MNADRIRLLNIRNSAETLVEAMQSAAFVADSDICDLVSHVDAMAADATSIESADLRIVGMRVATAVSSLARAYINSRALAA